MLDRQYNNHDLLVALINQAPYKTVPLIPFQESIYLASHICICTCLRQRIPYYLTLYRIIIISALQYIQKYEGMLAQHTSGKVMHFLKNDSIHKTGAQEPD